MSRWFRLYDEMLDDPKVQRLDPALFRTLVNLWCIASRHDGHLPPVSDLGFSLRLGAGEVAASLAALREAGFLDADPATGALRPHGWDRRQYRSDCSTERVRALRSRRRQQAEAVAPDPARAVFDEGVPLLTAAGQPPRAARSLVARWRKAIGDADLLALIRQSAVAGQGDAAAWLTTAVENHHARHPEPARARAPARAARDPYADRCRDPVLQAFADGSLT